MNTSEIIAEASRGQSPRPVAQLTTLYKQMAAAGYACDHPWCLALAGIISAEEDAAILEGESTGIDTVRQQAYEIESRIGNIAVLMEAIFDKIDTLICVSPEQHNAVIAINTFANSAMESAKAIRIATEEILTLSGGVQ